MAKRPLRLHPGTNYVYGYSIDILGRYIEAIEGKPLDVVMRERVFDRLGMNDSEFWVRKAADRARYRFLPPHVFPLCRRVGFKDGNAATSRNKTALQGPCQEREWSFTQNNPSNSSCYEAVPHEDLRLL